MNTTELIGWIIVCLVCLIPVGLMWITGRISGPSSNAPIIALVVGFGIVGFGTLIFLTILFGRMGQEIVEFGNAYATQVALTPTP